MVVMGVIVSVVVIVVLVAEVQANIYHMPLQQQQQQQRPVSSNYIGGNNKINTMNIRNNNSISSSSNINKSHSNNINTTNNSNINYNKNSNGSNNNTTTNSSSTNTNNVQVEVSSTPKGWGLVIHKCLPKHNPAQHTNVHNQPDYQHYTSSDNNPSNHNPHSRQEEEEEEYLSSCHNTSQPLVQQGFTLLPQQKEHPTNQSPDPQQEAEAQEGGMTLSVLNQRTSALIFQKIFHLGQYWAHWSDLEWHLERVAPGRVVVMTVAVSGTVGLRHAAQQLTQLGSLLALHLTPMAHWTWVFIKGGRTLCETATLHSPAPHQAHLLLPLSLLPTPDNNNQQRWHYCQVYGAMGGLCDEYNPDPLPVATAPAVGLQETQALAGVPVVVTAGKRHQYLYQSLKSLLAAPGAQHNNILVILGDAPQATTQLLHLLQLNFTTLPVQGQDNDKLFHYYRSVFHLLAQIFPRAPAVILLDEDVQVSPDFFSYMSQTLWLLHQDPTLYCINTHGGTKDLAHDKTKVYRGEIQVSWGYAISLDFIREALKLWPLSGPVKGTNLYDYWLYRNVARGRECIFPDVSRSRHYGIGVNTLPVITETIFLLTPIVEEAGVALMGVDRLLLPIWTQDLTASIRGATPLINNPCSDTFVPVTSQPTTYVFYLEMPVQKDGIPGIWHYFHVTQCLGAWSLSEEGMHKGVRTLQLSPNVTLHLVGVPFSPYSYLRPPEIPVWSVTNLSQAQKQVVQQRFARSVQVTITNTNLTDEQILSFLFGKQHHRPQ